MTGKGYAVITGASAGLGEVFSFLLAREGYSLILVARREALLKRLRDRLTALTKPDQTIIVLAADLTVYEELVRVMDTVKEFDITLWINNAGCGVCGEFTQTELSRDLAMLDLNVRALHYFTKEAVRLFEEKKTAGRLLNVASSAGLLPAGPYMAAYYAGKSYVTSLTRALACELSLRHSPIYVGCLCPGPVDTDFNASAGVKTPLKGMSAMRCAKEALKGMKRGKTVIVPGLSIRLLWIFGRFLPEGILIRMTARQQKRKLS